MFRAACSSLTLLAVFAAGLFAQGLDTTATKGDWEEINFEFSSSVLVDGYPSLLQLAELLQKNPGYKVKIEGHTDWIGNNRYNDKLAVARATAVKGFLIKYGARPDQAEVTGFGKTTPKVDNRNREGRFMNRRVVLTLYDGKGNVVSAGSVGDAINAFREMAKKQEDCCNEILRKLDKLDEILAMLKDLKGENDRLKKDVAELRDAQGGMKRNIDQIAAAPKPPEPPRPPERPAPPLSAKHRMEKFSILGINAGPDMTGNTTFTGKGRFFAPFSSTMALQAEAEYMYFHERQEGQFDFGLVNRFRNVQTGLFSTFKHVTLRDMQQGGTLGQMAMTFDYLFSGGRVGLFGTKAFLNDAVINRTPFAHNVVEETYLHTMDQIGGSAQIGLWKNSFIEGNLGALFRQGGNNRPGGMVRLVQPVNAHVAFTLEAGLNETMLSQNNNGRVAVGVQVGNFVRPKEFQNMKQPVPVDIPRLRYEMLTRRVRTGNDPPVADAGPDQNNVVAGTITLDGSGSYDPEGDPMTYAWTQTSGPTVSISGVNSVRASFTAAAGVTYTFRLTVKDDHGGQGIARVTISTKAAPQSTIVRFEANPSSIKSGQTTTLVWEVQNADTVTISGIGAVDPKTGTSTLALTETTTFQLTAKNAQGEVNKAITVTVDRLDVRVLSFSATPANISKGEASTLAWQTENADTVSISGIGDVKANGTASVSPTITTTYTITAKNKFGTVNSTATVVVAAAQAPRILRFAASPVEILPTEQASLVWQVENATQVSITGIGQVELIGTSTVSPKENTTYTITATNALGQVSATATVGVIAPAKILNFVAEPSSIKSGESTHLTWSTQNTTEVIITGIGTVAANGSMDVKPAGTVSYSLLAYGKRSQVTALVIVTVGSAASAVNHPPVADAGPNQTVNHAFATLDGSRSYDPDGDPITYSWRVSGAFPATITGANTATPTVTLGKTWGEYVFELTVTDDKGLRSVATTIVNWVDP